MDDIDWENFDFNSLFAPSPEQMNAASQPWMENDLSRLPTGFIDLDVLLGGGFQPGDLVVLAARPSLGKTALAFNLLRNATVRLHAPSGLFSLELSVMQANIRFLALESEIALERIAAGRFTAADMRRLSEAVEVLSVAPLRLATPAGLDRLELETRARELQGDSPLALLVVDSWSLVEGSGAEVARGLKAVARELGCVVLVTAPVNHAADRRAGHRAELADLPDESLLEEIADTVIFLTREDFYDRDSDERGVVELHVAKQRNGPTGTVYLLYFDRTLHFVDLGHAPSHEPS